MPYRVPKPKLRPKLVSGQIASAKSDRTADGRSAGRPASSLPINTSSVRPTRPGPSFEAVVDARCDRSAIFQIALDRSFTRSCIYYFAPKPLPDDKESRYPAICEIIIDASFKARLEPGLT